MKSVGYITAILFIIIALSYILILAEISYLETYPPHLSQSSGVNKGEWITIFKKWAFFCGVSAGISSLLWYVLAQWGFKVDRWEDTEGKRPIWFLLSLAPIIMGIVSCIFIVQPESRQLEIYCFFFLNGLLPYYISTLLFSPSTFKYIPVLAKTFRSQCFW